MNYIINKKGINYSQHDFKTDFSIMINAKNLALSRGSLGYAIVLFSKGINNLFTFNQPSSRLPNHFNCVPSQHYIKNVILKWENSLQQRNFILNSSCVKWDYIQYGNQNLDAFLHEKSI